VNLQNRHGAWRSSPLSDLAFSITTRLGALQEAVHLVDEALSVLGRELEKDQGLQSMIDGEFAYDFDDMSAARRALLLMSTFVTEGLALFDNLVEFYRRFLEQYFDQDLSKAEAEEAVRCSATPAGWYDSLVRVRNHVVHRYAPWLAFEDNSPAQPRFEPILVHDWRPERLGPETSTSMRTLTEIKAGLAQAANGILQNLIAQVKATA
jgi:hypothetical protein